MDGTREGLRACEAMYLPLLVPCGAYRQTGSAQLSQEIRDAEVYEAQLAITVRVRAIGPGRIEGTLPYQDERAAETLAGNLHGVTMWVLGQKHAGERGSARPGYVTKQNRQLNHIAL